MLFSKHCFLSSSIFHKHQKKLADTNGTHSTTWASNLKKIEDDGFDNWLSLDEDEKKKFIQRAKWERAFYATQLFFSFEDKQHVKIFEAALAKKICQQKKVKWFKGDNKLFADGEKLWNRRLMEQQNSKLLQQTQAKILDNIKWLLWMRPDK